MGLTALVLAVGKFTLKAVLLPGKRNRQIIHAPVRTCQTMNRVVAHAALAIAGICTAPID